MPLKVNIQVKADLGCEFSVVDLTLSHIVLEGGMEWMIGAESEYEYDTYMRHINIAALTTAMFCRCTLWFSSCAAEAYGGKTDDF